MFHKEDIIFFDKAYKCMIYIFWLKQSGVVLNGNDQDHVATSSGCNTNREYPVLNTTCNN